MKSRRRTGHLLLLAVVFILLAFAGGYFYYRSLLNPVSDSQETISFTIQEGESLDEVLDNLSQDDLIHASWAAKLYSKLNHVDDQYAGTFVLTPSMSTPEILDYLADPNNAQAGYVIITEPEGTWAKELAAELAHQFPEYTTQDFLDLWNDPDYLSDLAATYSWFKPDEISPEVFVRLEGYLFPETYFMDPDFSMEQITGMFLDQFDQVIEGLKTEISRSDYNLEEILTLASIVQFESGDPSEMKDIAGVFYNRLEQGMPLGSSVTVCYALYDDFENHQDCEIHTDIDSPYNTYIYQGLPVGPILNPGKEAIEAVLDPNENDYLYFVSDIYGDGSIHYAKTYEEHLENVERYNLVIE